MPDDLVLLRAAARDRGDLLSGVRRHAAALESGSMLPHSTGACRLAIVAPARELKSRLALASERIASIDKPRFAMRNHGIYFGESCEPGKVALLFPGQGSQHPGMLRELYDRVPVVRTRLDALDRAAARAGEPPLTELIYGDAAAAAKLYDLHRGAQLGTAAALSLHELLTRCGVEADFIIGHSNGEHAAMFAGGIVAGLELDALCDTFIRAGAVTASLPPPEIPEAMAAVSAIAREQLQALVARHDGCFLAMDNCPHQLVVAGRADALERLRRDVLAANAVWGELPFTRAYHTPLFANWAAALTTWYDELPFAPARVPVYSCLSAAPIPADPAAARDAIARQWLAPVRFRDTIEAVYAAGARTFIEVGPDSKLTAFTDDVLRGRDHVAASMSSVHLGELAQLRHLAAELFTTGLTLDLSILDCGSMLPLSKRRHAAALQTHQRLTARATESMARVRERLATHREELRFTRATHAWLDDHAFGRGERRFPVLPFTMSIALAAAAAEKLTGQRVTSLTNIRAQRWLAVEQDAINVSVEARRKGEAVAVSLNDAFAAETWRTGNPACPALDLPTGRIACPPRRWSVARFYRDYAFHGPRYQTLFEVLSIGEQGIEAELITRAPVADLPVDPALLDAAGQLVAFWLLEHAGREPSFGIFPFAAARVALHAPPLPAGSRAHCRAAIRMTPVGTSADFEFRDERGRLLVTIEGFEQRLIEFPHAVAETIFRGNAVPLGDDDLAFMSGSGGIFDRAIAYLTDKDLINA